ncbi:MAG: helix-turn-helix domain-containing protein [Ruminococcus sp.]|nr:helix-turn-helix domain-containing protein [Ruminococcus sp.]
MITNYPRMLTVNQTADTFGISKHFSRQLALSGRVCAVRSGSKILINADSVASFLSNSKLNEMNNNEAIPKNIK